MRVVRAMRCCEGSEENARPYIGSASQLKPLLWSGGLKQGAVSVRAKMSDTHEGNRIRALCALSSCLALLLTPVKVEQHFLDPVRSNDA
jgi:hypothetical protein